MPILCPKLYIVKVILGNVKNKRFANLKVMTDIIIPIL